MQKVKNTIPVYDICSLSNGKHIHGDIIAAPFADYLQVHPNLHLAHRHSFYHIVLFTKGGGHHTIDFERFAVQPGQVYFMVPGQVHSWSFEGEVDGYVINFAGELFSSFLSNDNYLDRYYFFSGVAHEGVHQLPDDTCAAATQLFKHLVTEVNNNDAYAADSIRTLLIQLFIAVQRSIAPTGDVLPAPRQNQLILSGFRKLVDTHFAEKRLPKDYASLLYITPNHLNALCKDLLGIPAGELIRNRVLLEAKRLLVNADKTIADIALELNFGDNAHFTKFFKKLTGLAPGDFRKTTIYNNKH